MGHACPPEFSCRRRTEVDAGTSSDEPGIKAEGSDSPNPFVYPGLSLQDELALLVHSGLTPAQALRTATINRARFLVLTDSLGVV
ncbi:MAG: hypothetical protein NVS1B5_15350 [Gemmatimonadaceae bacterium]